MTIYILIIVLLIGVPLVIGISYLAKNTSEKHRVARGRDDSPTVVKEGSREPRKGDPVTLDRSPEMPHKPGATS